jgi:hypothetical protein
VICPGGQTWKTRTASDYGAGGAAAVLMVSVASPIKAFKEFWRGEVPLGRAFWVWAILGGAAVNFATTLVSLAIIARGGPGWLALMAFLAPMPWNIVLLVGVWRSADQADVRKDKAQMARLAIVVWVLVLSLI